MELTLRDVPKFIERQYTDDNEGFRLYYNPLGYGGITIADKKTQYLVQLCDGVHTIEDMAKITNEPIPILLAKLTNLANHEVIKVSDLFTQTIHDSKKSNDTISCWIHLTNCCNLSCSYCYVDKAPKYMSLETCNMAIDKIIQSCKRHNIKKINIKFAGGEPLLRFKILQKVIEHANRAQGSINISYTLLTNATLITKDIALYLKDNNIKTVVSLDGVGAANDVCRHDIRGNGSFDAIVNSLNILECHNVDFSITTTITSQNFAELVELTKFLLEKKYKFAFTLERNFKTGRPILLTYKNELIDALNLCYDYIESNLPATDITSLHTFSNIKFDKPHPRVCNAGNTFFAIDHSHNLGICGPGLARPFSKLNPAADLLDHIRSHNQEMIVSRATDYPTCDDCIWSTSCAGGCPLQSMAAYGSYEHPSLYCKVFKAIIPRILHIKSLQVSRSRS
jgi:uncharacterized protein